MFMGWVFMILFWVAIILLIVWLYKQITGAETKPSVKKEELEKWKNDLDIKMAKIETELTHIKDEIYHMKK